MITPAGTLTEAVAAVAVRPPMRFAWFGRPSAAQARWSSFAAAREPAFAREVLVRQLQERLYADFYRPGRARPALPEDEIGAGTEGSPTFVADLSAAHGGGRRPARGILRALDGDRAGVDHDGLVVWCGLHDLGCDGRDAVPGSTVELPLPALLKGLSPGFWLAVGERDVDVDARVVRVYWNVAAAAAPSLVRLVTRRLNRANLSFRLKVVNDPARFDRCDAAVLYVRRSDYRRVARRLDDLPGLLGRGLRDGVPALTRRAAPGVGVAEDPGSGRSFGMHRCGALAEGIVEAHERRATAIHRRLAVVRDHFAQAGIDPDRPWTSDGDHPFEPAEWPARGTPRPARSSSAVGATRCWRKDESAVAGAVAIGRRLTASALWHEGSCNWVGTAPGGDHRWHGPSSVAARALGPDLYLGTSGIGLFLAELHAHTGERRFRRAARGALRHALRRAPAVHGPNRSGLFFGWTGIACAASRGSRLLKDPELRDGARGLAGRAASPRGSPRRTGARAGFDLLEGAAGGVLGLLALSEAFADPTLERAAALSGARLLASADRSRGLSWRSESEAHPNLTGLSHGASGVALAFIELFRRTSEPRWREAVLDACAYERGWFDADVGNWADLRGVGRRWRRRRLPRCAAGWCHGAPGIAVARLRAYEVMGDPECGREAAAALAATRTALVDMVEDGDADLSLCHGIAGNAEVLAAGHGVLTREETAGAEPRSSEPAGLVERAARACVHRISRRRAGWEEDPDDQPGLMLGLAGVGLFLLRLHDPSVPTPLLLRPDALA